MNIIDSSAWVSYLTDDRYADVLAESLSDFNTLLVPSITLTEVFKFTAREGGTHAAMRAAAQMRRGRVIALDDSLAIESARIGLQLKLPLADSIIYATAQRCNALLWTRGADFKGLPGVKYFP